MQKMRSYIEQTTKNYALLKVFFNLSSARLRPCQIQLNHLSQYLFEKGLQKVSVLLARLGDEESRLG